MGSYTFYPNLTIFLHRCICHICDISQLCLVAPYPPFLSKSPFKGFHWCIQPRLRHDFNWIITKVMYKCIFCFPDTSVIKDDLTNHKNVDECFRGKYSNKLILRADRLRLNEWQTPIWLQWKRAKKSRLWGKKNFLQQIHT